MGDVWSCLAKLEQLASTQHNNNKQQLNVTILSNNCSIMKLHAFRGVRFALLLLVLASGVSGLRPRRNLLPDDDHSFLRREDGDDRLPDIILPSAGHRHLTINGVCDPCCDEYGRDGCYLCKTSKSGKKDEVLCTAKTSKSEKKTYHDGHDRVEDAHECGHATRANLFGSDDAWVNCFHQDHPCDAIGEDGTRICSTDDYCTSAPPPGYEPPFGEEFCPSPSPSAMPSVSPEPSSQPSSSPSSDPSSEPSSVPSASPSSDPSEMPSAEPSSEPSLDPSSQPSSYPSSDPSSEPSGAPSATPSSEPSKMPSSEPSSSPSSEPSSDPSSQPSSDPSSDPSLPFEPDLDPDMCVCPEGRSIDIIRTWLQFGGDIDGEAAYDYSGNSVSLSSDGTVVAIGAYGNDDGGSTSGHVRVYGKNESDPLGWTQIGQDIDGEAAGDYSGWSVSLSSDGTVVAIGAFSCSGRVRVYKFDDFDDSADTPGWIQIGQDIDGEAVYDSSGRSVSLSSDGTVVAIGAYANDGGGSSSGHVRVHRFGQLQFLGWTGPLR